ncbi:MAG: hypothetical protein QOG15_1047 [Solirubrobacteraceae bacterium]|jgi:uncharacterized membrane protein YczE|nr:hypothetical protein [Solirubrobacteraceae bacterium]
MPSRWRPGPARFARLLLGLAIFGAGEALLVASDLGNSPWTVLAEGLGDKTAIGVGAATVVLSLVVLLSWIPLRQGLGLGTILNALLVGVALGLVLEFISTPDALLARYALVAAGIALVGLGSGLYLGTQLGPGPRDGLMLGIHRRTGVSVRLARTAIEVTVVVAGALLGGTAGIGTLAFALLIGPAVQAALIVLRSAPAAEL